jgi:hypothetical protein
VFFMLSFDCFVVRKEEDHGSDWPRYDAQHLG